jgi:serine-type D-Ala-D-Ala carboxypeptidase (penicillin-binding protein 5/6)
MVRKRVSLYTALTVAVMSAFLLMSYAVLQYIPFQGGGEALLIRTPRLTTKTWAVFDVSTGLVRYGNQVDSARPIASLTKLFTAYMVMRTEDTETEVTITWEDLNTEGDFGKLKHGETLTFSELLFPLLIESSNDAGTAIARTFGPLYDDVVQGAVDGLGLKDTRIVDGTGLSKDDVSSPRDLAKFFSYIRHTYPHITDITQLRMYITKERGLVNNNPGRSFASFTGGKQGYIPESEKTFVGTFKLSKSKQEVGIVLLGSTDLRSDIGQILNSLN